MLADANISNDADWWRGAVIYQIYPRSFQDDNGDGTGDLPGITRRLPYVASLGVDAIWISPVYVSPMDDFGYDVSDYCDIDPLFGTLADFDAMLAEAHRLGLKVMVDLVLSHTSDQHPWFKESRADKANAKADWFVWADAHADGTPPNNWLSIFGGSAWEWDTARQQYYLHNFLTSQPDLNFHNGEVRAAVLDVVRYWLDRGVDGFRLDTANFYYHDADLRNNPPAPSGHKTTSVSPAIPYARQLHIYDKTRPENLAFLEAFRALLDGYEARTSMGELGLDENVADVLAQYTERDQRLHMAYAFSLFFEDLSATAIRTVVAEMDAGIGSGWPAYAMSNHDVRRTISRYDLEDVADQAAPALIALLTSLRGSFCIYQGEELGLPEADVPFEQLQDPPGIRFWPVYKGRDGCRTPMPWRRDNANAGFSDEKPWLPVDQRHSDRAVAVQQDDPMSCLNRVRAFLQWRKSDKRLVSGNLIFLETPEPLIAFVREETLLCVFSLSRESVAWDLPVDATAIEVPGLANAALAGRRISFEPFGALYAEISPS